MKRQTSRLRALFAVLLVAAAIGIAATYPAIGGWTFDIGARTEARLYGLHTEVVNAGDVTLHVYRGGTAPGRETLVLLHGYSGDRQLWPRFARHLLDRYEILIPDLAGHGDSGFTPGLGYSAPAQAQRVIAMLDTLGIARAHVAGNSMGGFIAAHLALSHADRIASATLIDPAGVASPRPSDLQRLLDQGRNPFQVHSRAEFDAFYAMTMTRPPYMPGFVLAAMAQRYEQRAPQLAEIFADFAGRDTLDARLGDIRVPTLVIWGREDRLIDVSAAPVWAQGIAGARLEILDGIGHMPMVEVPAETAASVGAFLAALPH